MSVSSHPGWRAHGARRLSGSDMIESPGEPLYSMRCSSLEDSPHLSVVVPAYDEAHRLVEQFIAEKKITVNPQEVDSVIQGLKERVAGAGMTFARPVLPAV